MKTVLGVFLCFLAVNVFACDDTGEAVPHCAMEAASQQAALNRLADAQEETARAIEEQSRYRYYPNN